MSKRITRIHILTTRWKRTFITLAVVLLPAGAAVLVQPVLAQIPKLPGVTQKDTKEGGTEAKAVSPAQQRETTRRALLEAQAERDRALAAAQGVSRPDVKEQYRLLDGLVIRLNSQLNLIDEREELRRARTVAAQTAKSWVTFSKPPPYPILMVDEITGTVLAARARETSLRTNQEILARQLSQFRESAQQTRAQERQAIDTFARLPSSGEQSPDVLQKELTVLRTRSAAAMAELIALRYEVLGEKLGIATLDLELLERQLTEARKQMVFKRADLDTALERLKSERNVLERELEATLSRDALTRKGLERSQQERDSFNLRHGTEITVAKTVALREVVEARHRAALAWVESNRFETEVVSALIAINKSESSSWEQRYTAVSGTDAEKRRTILAEFRTSLERNKPWLEFVRHQMEMYQAAEQEQEKRLANIVGQEPLRAAERDLLAALQQQRKQAERQKAAVEQVAGERTSWLADMERIRQTRSIAERSREWLGAVPNILRSVWRFELFAIEDSVEVAGQKVVASRGVTVGKSAGALFLFMIGYMIAVFLGRRVQQVMVARFGIGEHQANVIRRWLMALTIFLLLIITLNLARIPLTVFAFLGGALVIGVGFGTQTLIKNFISGILILLERNVKVGDTIDVDGVVGRIVTVDTRASTVLGFDGVETVIPNSMFLENKVTNWTHSNTRLRRIVRVGVAYGSPTTRVRDILAACGNEHGLILKDPPPEALFEDFGENSLIFALYFWIEYGSEVNPLQVASDLRFSIDRRFAEEQIVLAFPQRDVHFDSLQPLRIEITAPAGKELCAAI